MANPSSRNPDRSKSRTSFIVLGSGLISLALLLVTFSRPPLAQSSVAHYMAVVVFYLLMTGFWTLVSSGVFRMLSGPAVSQAWESIVSGPVFASMGFSMALLLAMASWASETEIGFILAALFILLGFCLASAALASHWANRSSLSMVGGMIFAGLGALIGILMGAWLTFEIFGEDFLDYNVMMFNY